MIDAEPSSRFFLGLDLGQAADYTALAILEQDALTTSAGKHTYNVRHLQRYELGTAYPNIVADLRRILSRRPLLHAWAALAVDATGVGAAVVDMIRPFFPGMAAVTITGGRDTTAVVGGYNVPKLSLVSTLQVLLQSRRLRIASQLPAAEVLGRELQAKAEHAVEGRDALRQLFLGWIPGISGVLATMKHQGFVGSDAFRIQEELHGREQVLRINSARAANVAGRDIQFQSIGRDAAHYEALSRFGMSSLPQQARIWDRGQKALDVGPGRIQAGAAGYDRASAMHDFAGSIAHRVALAQHDAEGRRQTFILGHEKTAAAQTTRKARANLAQQQKQLEIAQRDVGRGGGDEEAQMRRRLDLEEQLVRFKEAQRVLDDAMAQERRLAIQQSSTLNQLGDQRLRIVQQESERLRSIIREEKEHETSRREPFGLLHPRKQMTYLGIAKKLQMGMNLTTRDIEVAQSAPGNLFGERLRKIAMSRTGVGSVLQQIQGMLPELGARQKHAEKALAAVNQQFQVQIQLNEKSVADQLVKEVLPAINRAVEGVKTHFQTEQQRMLNQMWINQRQQFPGA